MRKQECAPVSCKYGCEFRAITDIVLNNFPICIILIQHFNKISELQCQSRYIGLILLFWATASCKANVFKKEIKAGQVVENLKM